MTAGLAGEAGFAAGLAAAVDGSIAAACASVTIRFPRSQEATRPGVDIFDHERVFVQSVLPGLLERGI